MSLGPSSTSLVGSGPDSPLTSSRQPLHQAVNRGLPRRDHAFNNRHCSQCPGAPGCHQTSTYSCHRPAPSFLTSRSQCLLCTSPRTLSQQLVPPHIHPVVAIYGLLSPLPGTPAFLCSILVLPSFKNPFLVAIQGSPSRFRDPRN